MCFVSRVLALFLLPVTLFAAAQPNSNPSFSFQQSLSKDQMQNMGLNKLSSKQLQALEAWISNYTSTQSSSSQKLPSNALTAVIHEGQFLKLENGDVWNVSPNAWIYTYYWQKGDVIKSQKGLDMLFPFSLTNERTGQQINAKKGSKEITQSLSSKFTISSILNNGEFIKLSNDSTWQVEPSARYMVQGWTLGQPIFVMERNDAVGYELYNGTTARTVLAVPFNSSKIKTYDEKKGSSSHHVNSSNFNQISPQTDPAGNKTPAPKQAPPTQPIKVTSQNYTQLTPQKVEPQVVVPQGAAATDDNSDTKNANQNSSTQNPL